ncbi:MAG: hypothetical protein ACOX4R_00565 [Lentihominibacter sp.]
MNKRITKALLIIISFIVAATFSLVPVDSFAASKVKKSTVYSCIKSKNVVYCENDFRVFKVNLDTQDVQVMADDKYREDPEYLKLKGNYLYYMGLNPYEYCVNDLYRVNIKTFQKKRLASNVMAYAISGSKIYYVTENYDTGKRTKRVMKLNGKSKKKTKYSAKMSDKYTNAGGYYVWDDYDSSLDWGDEPEDEWCNYYLATPNGDILLESVEYPLDLLRDY